MAPLLYALILSNINQLSKLFHYQHQEKLCNNRIDEDPTTPQCVATLPCLIKAARRGVLPSRARPAF